MSDLVVEASGLEKIFELPSETVRAVAGVDLQVHPRQLVCVIGESGSGKSTLLELIAGLEFRSAGSLRVFGQDFGPLGDAARAALRLRKIGVVFQEHNLIDEFTAVENVMLPLEALGLAVGEARSQALECLAKVGIDALADRRPFELSGGQRQRVGIARALVGERELIVADEPTGALDSENSKQLLILLRQMCDQGYTVILATHEIAAQEYADRVYRMTDGMLGLLDGV